MQYDRIVSNYQPETVYYSEPLYTAPYGTTGRPIREYGAEYVELAPRYEAPIQEVVYTTSHRASPVHDVVYTTPHRGSPVHEVVYTPSHRGSPVHEVIYSTAPRAATLRSPSAGVVYVTEQPSNIVLAAPEPIEVEEDEGEIIIEEEKPVGKKIPLYYIDKRRHVAESDLKKLPESEAASLDECSFHPTINKRRNYQTEDQGVFERIGVEDVKKRVEHTKHVNPAENDPAVKECTFRPRVYRGKLHPKEAVDRLYREDINERNSKFQSVQERVFRERGYFNQGPVISKDQERMFVDRMVKHAQRKKQELEAPHAPYAEYHSETAIGRRVMTPYQREMYEANTRRENSAVRKDDSSNSGKKQEKDERAPLTLREREECQRRLLNKDHKKKVLEDLQKRHNEAFRKEYPFTPAINNNEEHARRHKNNFARSTQVLTQRQKEQQLEKKKKIQLEEKRKYVDYRAVRDAHEIGKLRDEQITYRNAVRRLQDQYDKLLDRIEHDRSIERDRWQDEVDRLNHAIKRQKELLRNSEAELRQKSQHRRSRTASPSRSHTEAQTPFDEEEDIRFSSGVQTEPMYFHSNSVRDSSPAYYSSPSRLY